MKYDVYGIGNILVDLLIEIDEEELKELGLKKGRFHLVGEELKKILEGVKEKEVILCPAGSCANTVSGISGLGGNVVLSGKIGKDKHGDFYEKTANSSVKSNLVKCDISPTGKVACFITPDAERTIVVDLGANLNLKKHEISEEDIKNSKIIHLTGYFFESTKDVALHAIELAKKHNVKISIDLSDPGVIERNAEELKTVVKEHADIIFLNEDEAKAFTGKETEDAISELGDYANIAIVKLGANGSLINDRGAIIIIEGVKANAVDTTGAGDMYAAGILYGLSKGYDLEKAGQLASKIAAKIVEQIGARPEFDLKEFLEE